MFFRKLNWNVVSWFRTVSLISSLVIAAGIGTMIWHGFQGGNGFQAGKMLQLGLSFTGGTSIDVTFTQPVPLDTLRSDLAPLNLNDETIRSVGSPQGTGYLRYQVETTTPVGNDAKSLKQTLGKAGNIDLSKLSVNAVGPTLGREYLTKAVEALIIALGIQFIYIAFRFGWNYIFGLVTVIALVRDAVMMIGIYAMAGKRADDAFLAAVLTVIGYSVMDTIVILDRIRENTKLMAGQPYDRIVNTSILQTMTRSFNTLATVVITLVALLALGGTSLQNFGFALLVGICSGGYHSIFFSAPLVLGFRKRQLDAAARKRAAGLASDRTRSARSVAESRALGSQGGVAREDIVAARKARRQKTKAARPAGSSPTRYKKKRAESGTATTVVESPDAYEEEIDPLDAQARGLDEAAFDQGHEEINLNLDEFEPERELPPHDAEHREE